MAGVVFVVVVAAEELEVSQVGFAALAPGFLMMDYAPFRRPFTPVVLVTAVPGDDGSA